jgi:hypothetical protein
MAKSLANALASALGGIPPKSWAKAENCGYGENIAIPDEVLALRYVEMCKARVIHDVHPVPTILEEFKVSRRTYDNWRAVYRDNPQYSWLLKYMPPQPGDIRTIESDAEMWTGMMLAAAARYRGETLKSK